MRAANRDDRASYYRLLHELAPVLRGVVNRGFARYRLGFEDVEDVVQETLLVLHLKRHNGTIADRSSLGFNRSHLCGAFEMRAGAARSPAFAGAAAGLLASGLAATLYATHCVDDSILFVALWYIPTIALAALIGFAAGSRLLRW